MFGSGAWFSSAQVTTILPYIQRVLRALQTSYENLVPSHAISNIQHSSPNTSPLTTAPPPPYLPRILPPPTRPTALIQNPAPISISPPRHTRIPQEKVPVAGLCRSDKIAIPGSVCALIRTVGVAVMSSRTAGGPLLPASVLEEALGFGAETPVAELGVVSHGASA